MKRSVSGRQYYRLSITTTPPITSWSASFDHGTTWVAGNAEGNNVYSWLLDTPSTVGGHSASATQVSVGAGDFTHVKVKATDGSEVLVLDVPDFCNIEWVE